MTTAAGPLNLAGTASPVSVAQELGLGLTTAISLDQANVRTLAGAGGSGTVISMSQLLSKSNGDGGTAPTPFVTATTWSGQKTSGVSSITLNADGTISSIVTSATGSLQARWLSVTPTITRYVRSQCVGLSGTGTATLCGSTATAGVWSPWVPIGPGQPVTVASVGGIITTSKTMTGIVVHMAANSDGSGLIANGTVYANLSRDAG